MKIPAAESFLQKAGTCVLTLIFCLAPVLSAGAVSVSDTRSRTAYSENRPDSPTVADLKALADKIESESGRKELLEQIRALIALQKQPSPPAPEKSFTTRLGESIFKNLQKSADMISSMDGRMPRWKETADWIENQFRNPEVPGRLFRQALPAISILLLGWSFEFIAARLLSRICKRMEDESASLSGGLLKPALARAALRIAAPAAFFIVSLTAFFFLQPPAPIGGITLQMLMVYAGGRLFLILAGILLSPSAASFRLVPLRTPPATTLFFWIRRVVVTGIGGYLLAAATLLFGLPVNGFSDLIDILGFILVVMTIVGILRNHQTITSWIRGPQAAATLLPSWIRRIRSGLSAVWHILLIIYLLSIFVIWWQDIDGGFSYLIRGTMVTLLLMYAARIAIRNLEKGVMRHIGGNERLQDNFPTLTRRLHYYAPAVIFLLRGAIFAIAFLAILEIWQVDAHRWLTVPFVARSLSFIFTMTLVLAIAAIVWETVNIGVEHYLAASEKSTRSPGYRARVRTLLPLLRKVLMIVLAVMVVMIVLSEFGVNIGPLLTGAGIIGLAVGFGAQKLVQDIITGIFILLEDAVAIGDVVEVAGIGGVVEDLSIRSIRLRDLSGNVHTIPFSSVVTVTNMTKQYSYYLLDIGVAYREDTDHVAAVCREILDELRRDPELGPDILEPLEVLGVDQFSDSAVIIKARIKTQPIRQWAVGREFNRRMKKRFDELGIEIPYPHRRVYFGTDKNGDAARARLVVEH